MSKYPWNEQRIAKSPFARGKTIKEALSFAKQKEKDFEEGKHIHIFIEKYGANRTIQ